jgi:hypothetical protein
MNEAQLSKSLEIEHSIIALATLKLSMIARGDSAGHKRICKQQALAMRIGQEIIEQVKSNSTSNTPDGQ